MTMDLQQQVRQEQTRLEAVVADALAIARQLGADSAEVSISKQTGLSVNTRGGEVEGIEFNKDGALGIAVYRDGRKGSSSTTDLGPLAVRSAVEAALEISRHTAADPTQDSRMPNGWPGMFPIWTCYTPLSGSGLWPGTGAAL